MQENIKKLPEEVVHFGEFVCPLQDPTMQEVPTPYPILLFQLIHWLALQSSEYHLQFVLKLLCKVLVPNNTQK